MKLRVVSDLHFEFHPDKGAALLRDITAEPFDALVVAGDLCSAQELGAALRLVGETVNAPIVYVHGNHEFYGSRRSVVLDVMRRAKEDVPHLHFLDCAAVGPIHGHRVIGTPLWFRKSNAPRWAMNDFSQIEKFDEWVYSENGRGAHYLAGNMLPGDIVVTHYLPAEQSVAPQFKGNPLNPFFLCDMTVPILAKRPRLWVHGHTHCSCRYTIGETEVVCNPYGYFGHETNREFDPALTIEVQP